MRRSVDISPLTKIGYGIRMAHPIGIVIGDRCELGNYVSVLQNVTLGGTSDKVREIEGKKKVMPIVSDFVEIGCHSAILGPVIVEKCGSIGANSVVVKDVPKYSIVVGSPAKVIKVKTKQNLAGLTKVFRDEVED